MAQVRGYECLNCHAELTFDPAVGHWHCAYCFSDFSKEELDKAYSSEEAKDAMNSQEQEHNHEHSHNHEQELGDTELDVYHCESCGADLVADETTSSTFCLYCKSPVVIKQRFKGAFEPAYVIPFKITQEDAVGLYREWIKKKILTPKEYKQDEEIEKIKGIYAPFWLFDSTAHVDTEGTGIKVRHWRSGDYEYTQKKYYRVVRSGHVSYEKVPVDSSQKLDDTFMQMIEPYDYKELTDFSMHYMAGFMAEMYDVSSEESAKVMKERVSQFASTRIRETINGYSSFDKDYEHIDFQKIDHHYTLMPIYMVTNIFKDKTYRFFINGQTGKIVGETPISKKRQFALFSAIFWGIFILLVIGGVLVG